MTDYSDIDSCLGSYGDAFDLYMDSGEMPPSIEEDDPLGGYVKTAIDNNPQIDGSDPLWVDVFKDGLMGYLNQLLKVFKDIQRETEREMAIIDEFEKADIDKKRQMWGAVCSSIRAKYSRYEVDIQGFTDQFSTGDRDAVFAAMISDWRNACTQSCIRRQQQLFASTRRKWEMSMVEIGSVDYEERRRIADIAFESPVLSEIIEIIGRERESSAEEDNIIYSFIPAGARSGLPSEDIDSIENGDNLHRVLPAEFAMPDDIFFKKFATKELQQLAPPRQRKPRKTEEHHPKPRLKKGPIIVGIDTSGSMYGRPEQIAKSLLIQLVKTARKEHRSCYLITFSVRAKSIDLARSGSILKMKEFLDTHFTGGNGEEKLITEALRILETNDYELADVLIISDFIFNPPRPDDVRRINKAKALGTRFYGLQIFSGSRAYDSVLDRKWRIDG